MTEMLDPSETTIDIQALIESVKNGEDNICERYNITPELLERLKRDFKRH